MIVDLVAVDPEGRTWQRRWSFEKRVSKRESKRRGGGRYCPSLTLDKGTTERMEGEEKGKKGVQTAPVKLNENESPSPLV